MHAICNFDIYLLPGISSWYSFLTKNSISVCQSVCSGINKFVSKKLVFSFVSHMKKNIVKCCHILVCTCHEEELSKNSEYSPIMASTILVSSFFLPFWPEILLLARTSRFQKVFAHNFSSSDRFYNTKIYKVF